MNPNACQNRYESIVALVMGELDDRAAKTLQEHIAICDACRSVRDALAAEEIAVRSGFESLARSLEPVERAVREEIGIRQSQQPPPGRTPVRHIWKGITTMFLAHKRFSLAAATVLVGVTGILAFLLLPPTSTAYALEQTAEANRKILNYHVKITPAGEGIGEAWAQMDEKGEVIRLRIDFPKTRDGAKTAFWSQGKADVWFKDKNTYMTVNEPNLLKHFKDLRLMFDPKLAFEVVEEQQKAGKAKVETRLPQKDGDGILVHVTYPSAPDRQETFVINPKTKLITQIGRTCRVGNEWEKTHLDYSDYNQPIAEEIWRPELSKDILKVDQTTQEIGLPQDKLTDEEIAVKVAREFFEALIAKDYDKAGKLYEGIPAGKMKQAFGGVTFVRIVSVGKPTPHPDSATHFLQVPVEVEWMVDGKKATKKFMPNIRAAYNQPNRWIIGGGV